MIMTDPALIPLVLSSTGVQSRKEALPSIWRWLLGDGTSLSDYSTQPEAWPQERLKKRRVILSQHLPGQSAMEEVWRSLDWRRSGGVNDTFELFYELFFRFNWETFLDHTYTPEAKSSQKTLRQTGVAASKTAFHQVAYYDRQFSYPADSYHLSAELLERQNAIEVCLAILMAPDNAWPLTSALLQGSQEWDDSSLHGQNQLRFALTGVLLASFENTATVATWMAWLLATHSDWQERIAAQDEQALEWCLNETLRLYAPVWSMVRQFEAAGRVGEREVEAQSSVWISPWVQGRQKAFWERADEFLPERWEKLKVPRGQFFPFGSGLHSCPGEAAARTQISSFIRFLLSYCRIDRVEGAPLPRPFFGVTQRPEKEVWLSFKPLRPGS